MTELNLYEARTQDSEDVNLVLITDENNYVLAKTKKDERKRMKTVIPSTKNLILTNLSDTKMVNPPICRYDSGALVMWGIRGGTRKYDPIFIVRSRGISEERYVQWREQFLKEKEQRNRDYHSIHAQLKRTIDSLKRAAQEKAEKLQESISLETLLEP